MSNDVDAFWFSSSLHAPDQPAIGLFVVNDDRADVARLVRADGG
jgi:hypothetical protein